MPFAWSILGTSIAADPVTQNTSDVSQSNRPSNENKMKRNSNEQKLTALLVRSNGSGDVADAFQMPTVGVVRGFEVNAVLRGRHTHRVVPAAHSLVQPVQQVVTPALQTKHAINPIAHTKITINSPARKARRRRRLNRGEPRRTQPVTNTTADVILISIKNGNKRIHVPSRPTLARWRCPAPPFRL